MIEEGRWDDLLRKVPVKKGDFIMYQAALFMPSARVF